MSLALSYGFLDSKLIRGSQTGTIPTIQPGAAGSFKQALSPPLDEPVRDSPPP